MISIIKKTLIEQQVIIVTIFILITLIQGIFYSNISIAQPTEHKLLKAGIKGTVGFTFSNDLNTLKTNWIDMVAEESNVEIEGNLISVPLNFEYGFQPYLSVHPIKLLQVGIKMDFAYSSQKSTFENPIINETYELKFKTKSYIPGVFACLTLGKFEIGAAVIQSYNNIFVNDDFLGYNDTWYGKNMGYEFSLGFSTSHNKLLGFTTSIKYRGLKINEFEDTLNRKVVYNDTEENLSLNMSGIIINAGLYFQFINLKKKVNEESNITVD